MRRKNLMRLTAAMGMMMACSQVMQAAAPVWGNETVEETTAGSHDDLIEIPTLEDEEYPVDQGKQNYVLRQRMKMYLFLPIVLQQH